MNIVTFSKNSCIMVEGRENTGRFYIIQKGKVRISREADELTGLESNVAGPGDILGEMSLLENKPRAATAGGLRGLYGLRPQPEQLRADDP